KTILIISPQAWGGMFLSKHHYAMELAKRGNRVYFLNPPSTDIKLPRGKFLEEKPASLPNLIIIHHRLTFPYSLKFRFITIFHYLMRTHIAKLMAFLPSIEIVWSFDLGSLYPLRLFRNISLTVFQRVDEFNPSANPQLIEAGA